jgi:hypothetical protein
MTHEHLSNTQTLVERDVLPDFRESAENLIIVESPPNGEDVVPVRTEVTPILFEQEVKKGDTNSLRLAVRELDDWLVFRVKNELITQIYTGIVNDAPDKEDHGLNIQSVSAVLQEVIASEGKRHYEEKMSLELTQIPSAEMRNMPGTSSKVGTDYWKKDVENLWSRYETHEQMGTYIDQLQAVGAEGMYDLAEGYIERTLERARTEVVSILRQQKDELQSKVVQGAARIQQLEQSLEHLTGAYAQALEQVHDRDMQLLDYEADAHLLQSNEYAAIETE